MINRKSRIGIAAVLLAVALWASNVAEAKPGSVRGGLCLHVGATDVTGGVKLRCLKTLKGTKVWRVIFVATSTSSAASTTTTTATASSSPTTSTTAVLAPLVSLSTTWIQSNTWPRAVTVTANVAGTVYFAEGDFPVKTVSDITSAPSYRWSQGKITTANAPTSIAIDVDAVINGYYRVYVADSQGVLSTPAINLVTISIPRTPSAAEIAAGTTTTTVFLTCAQGGVCAFGEDGPGGGKVFYLSTAPFSSPGSACGINCHYLEVSPVDASNSIIWATTVAQCYGVGSDIANSNCQANSIYSNMQNQTSSRASSMSIGMGQSNTTAIIGSGILVHGGVSKSTYAAGVADDYFTATASDWFLPSKDELNQLCRYARYLTFDISATNCSGGTGGVRRSTYWTDGYWSSSEYTTAQGNFQEFGSGSLMYTRKDIFYYYPKVRPIRAF